ncbi:Auxin-responsive protein IAA13 [Heracleum sosnowskyi]|uniref:Auxin-responsive protein IAA13 n=1 Tax=Heracleum sosnowskyi TaxID=360622 RepID=A0AAD8HNH3_9APIA|nr:Auxin-responsive protein IAA13 [Heracleum sosnowskyi]
MSKLPFQLLELSIISAQDLSPVQRNLRTYAVIWINPERKLQSKINQTGHVNPTWNEKFMFRVDNEFLDSETAGVMIEVYALGWLRDVLVGSVRVLISHLIPPVLREQNNSSRRFVALQIRRPSGRPQGILNMGVTLVDNTMRSMPLCSEIGPSSSVGYRDLMDGKACKINIDKNEKNNSKKGDDKGKQVVVAKKGETEKEKEAEKGIKLWRSRSDRSDLNSMSNQIVGHKQNGGGGGGGGGRSSVVDGGSVINGSMLNGSEVGMPMKGGSMISDVGPSPSVVAAAVARGIYPTQLPVPHEAGSSILGDWTVEESSIEGLKSKIDRWRMEAPAVYNNYENQNQRGGEGRSSKRSRRRGGSGGGSASDARLISCFGSICGCEITIVCGGGNEKKKHYNRSDSSRINYDSD